MTSKIITFDSGQAAANFVAGAAIVATGTMVALELANVIAISWWIVFSPLLGLAGLIILAAFVAAGTSMAKTRTVVEV